jgi:hypothetical protein
MSSTFFFLFFDLLKEKHLTREREEKRKDRSPNKRRHPKAQNMQWGVLKGETK